MERYLQIKGEQNSPIFFPSRERGRNEHTERCTAKEEVGVEGLHRVWIMLDNQSPMPACKGHRDR